MHLILLVTHPDSHSDHVNGVHSDSYPHALRSQPGSHFNQIGRQREARIKEIRILGEKITPAINQMVRTKAAGVRAGGSMACLS